MESIFEIFFYVNNLINNNYLFSLIIFCLSIYIFATLSIPGIGFFWLFAGFVFGIYTGYILSAVFTSLGSLNLFLLSKTIFHNFFRNKFNKYIEKVEKKIKDSSYEILIILRLSPINIPFFFQNVALSFLKISVFKYIITTFIGLSPTILFVVLIGNTMSKFDDLKNFSFYNLLTIDFILLYSLILLIFLVRIFTKNRFKKN